MFDDYNDIDDFDGTDDADSTSSRRQLASYAVRSSYGEFRRSGVHQGGPINPNQRIVDFLFVQGDLSG